MYLYVQKPAFTFLSRNVKSGEKLENVFQGWIWWIFRDLPLTHLVSTFSCLLILHNYALETCAKFLEYNKKLSSPS